MRSPVETIPAKQFDGFRRGYYANPEKAPDVAITSPSINAVIDINGRAAQRLGYTAETTINLGGTSNPATAFYHQQYDVTVFAYGTAVKYYDWTTQQVYDTGLTLSSATITRFDAYAGDVYLTNTTDGLRRLVFFSLTAATTAGDSFVTMESAGAARLSVFSVNTGNLVIQGTTEAFTQPTTYNVSNAVNNGSGLIRITTSATNTLVTGMSVTIAGVTGTTEANGTWTITVIDTTHFDLQGSTFTNAYSANGTVTVNPNGIVRLTGTASKSYASGAVGVVVHNCSSGLEKGSKLFFWKERMGIIGSKSATNANVSTSTEFFGKFASANTLSDIINFTFGSGGARMEMVGKFGPVTNALPAKDFLYTFKQDQSYVCAAKDVITTGTGIGQTTPDLRDEVHGCINEDSACVVGNNEICYITNDKRIMRIKIATDSGAAVVFPDENFDFYVQDDLKNMDSDQTGARAFYHRAKKRSYFQIKIMGQWYWYVYDHGLPIYIPTAMGMNILYGAWYAPQQVFFAQDFFERKGVMYATDGSNDTVYSIGTSFDDNGSPITCAIYTGNFNVGSAEIQTASFQGQISEAAKISLQAFVTNTNGGVQATSQKIIDGSTYTYTTQHAVGADPVGSGGVESNTVTVAEWEKNFDVYPSEANKVQLAITNSTGGYFSISNYSIAFKPYPSRSSAL